MMKNVLVANIFVTGWFVLLIALSSALGLLIPSAANADDFAVEFGSAVGNFFDDRVESRDVSATGEDHDSFGHGFSWKNSGIRVPFQYTRSGMKGRKRGGAQRH